MKSKIISKKLGLNKKTISNLNLKEMTNLIGGASVDFTYCGALCTYTADCTAASCWVGCLTSANPRATCQTNEAWCI